MQQVYQEASSQDTGGLLIDRLKVKFENGIIDQLSLKVTFDIPLEKQSTNMTDQLTY